MTRVCKALKQERVTGSGEMGEVMTGVAHEPPGGREERSLKGGVGQPWGTRLRRFCLPWRSWGAVEVCGAIRRGTDQVGEGIAD